MIRTTKRLLHVLGFVVAGVAVLVGLGLWRLTAGPVPLSMISPLVGAKLEAAAQAAGNLRVKVGDTVMVWDDFRNPLELRLRDVEVIGDDGRPVITVPDLAVGFSIRTLFLEGRLALARLRVIRPTLHLERTLDGRLALDMNGTETAAGTGPGRVEVPVPAPAETASTFEAVLEILRQRADPRGPLGALVQVSITEAALTLEDRTSGVVWSIPRADLTLGRQRDGGSLAGQVELTLGGRTAVIEVSGRDSAGVRAMVRFRNVDPGALTGAIPALGQAIPALIGAHVPLSGEVEAGFDHDLRPQRLRLALTGAGLFAIPEAGTLRLDSLALAATLDVATGTVVLERAELTSAEPALRLTATGQGSGSLAAPNGKLQITATRGTRTARFEAILTPAAEGSTLSLRLDDLEPALFAPLAPQLRPLTAAAFPITGLITVALDSGAQPVRATVDIAGGAGRLVAPEALPEPVAVRGLTLKATIDHPFEAVPARLDLAGLVVEFADPTAGTPPTLKVDGSVVRTGERLAIVGGIRAQRVPIETLPRLWPPKVGKGARPWLVRNIVAGLVDDAWIRVDGTAPVADPGEIRATTLDAGIEASNLTVHYFKALPPVTGINGRGVSDGRNLILTTKGGRIGDLLVGDAKVDISKLDTPQEWIDIDAPLSGPVRTALTVLDLPPLRYPSRVGINPATTEGSQTCRLRFVFPLRNDLNLDQVAIHADAALHNASVQGIAGGIDASQGELKLALDDAGLDLTGAARLNGLASTIHWRENFSDTAEFGTKVAVKAPVGPGDLRVRGVDPGPMFTGSTDADLQVTIDRKKRIIANGVIDLARARLELPVLGVVKPQGQAGTARL